jgi:hypothetical protein
MFQLLVKYLSRKHRWASPFSPSVNDEQMVNRLRKIVWASFSRCLSETAVYIYRYSYIHIHIYTYIFTYIFIYASIYIYNRKTVLMENGKQKFVFLCRQTINSNQRLQSQQMCRSIPVGPLASA